MKHAILMTVYKDPNLINRIIKSYPNSFIIFVHIDKKSEIRKEDIISKDNVHVKKLMNVNWGGRNHVKAMLLLLKEAIGMECDYYHWVTGQDVPLFPLMFDNKLKHGYSYLEYFPLPRDGWCEGGLIRYQIYGFYDVLDAKKPKEADLIKKIEKWQKRLHFIRPFRDYSKIYAGSGYFSLYKTDAKILLEEAPRWLSFYKHTFCAEESIIQTILLNSYRAKYIINNNLRYIDWNVPVGPKVLTIDDYDRIIRSDCLFCRKVDSIQSNELLRTLNV